MKNKIFISLAVMFSICSCSEQGVDYSTLPDNAEAGKIYRLNTYTHEDTGREISEATFVVAENREINNSRLLALPLIIYKSTNPNPEEPVFWLTGGPGNSNLTYWPPDELLEQGDVVLLGYRGVDGSTVLACPNFMDGTSGLNLFSKDAISQMKQNVLACQENWADNGIDISCYSMTDVIDDMEAVRKALNYQTINLLSVSYGTRLAQIFATRYPQRANRSIMVSVNPPGHFVWDPETIDSQIRYYSNLWAQDPVFGEKTDNLAACMKRVMNNMPERWLFFKIDPDKVRFAAFMGLYHTSGAGSVFDAFIAADNGDASGLALVSFMTKWQLKKMDNAWGDMLGKSFADFDPNIDYYEKMKLNSHIIGSPGSQLFAVSDAWQVETKDTLYNKPSPSDVETLLLSGSIDLSTPAEFAKDELLPYLKNGEQFILSEYGHVGDIMNREHGAFVRAITSYYASGEADMSDYQAQKIDFTPAMSFPQLAKIAIGGMAGTILLIIGIVILVRYLIRKRKMKRKAATNSIIL